MITVMMLNAVMMTSWITNHVRLVLKLSMLSEMGVWYKAGKGITTSPWGINLYLFVTRICVVKEVCLLRSSDNIMSIVDMLHSGDLELLDTYLGKNSLELGSFPYIKKPLWSRETNLWNRWCLPFVSLHKNQVFM